MEISLRNLARGPVINRALRLGLFDHHAANSGLVQMRRAA